MYRPQACFVAVVVAIGLSLFPCASIAQDKTQFRDLAKGMASKLRLAGEPKDRCMIGALIVDGGIVVRTLGAGNMLAGDKIISVNQVDVSGKSSDEIMAVIREIAPSAVIPIQVDRDRETLNVEVSCSNARVSSEALLAGLDFAGAGKFDECVTAFSSGEDFGARGALMKMQCASISKNSKRYDLAQLGYEAIRLAIEEAHWNPAGRNGVIEGLRQAEGEITRGLGAARFQELVIATQRWPGSERLFESSAPDIALFRRASESALRSRLIDPESARIEWPYGFLNGYWKPLFAKRVDGYWTCGLINARNRMGGYTGSTSFVVILDKSGAVKYVEVGSGKDFDILSGQCMNSVKVLPPAPPELVGPIDSRALVPQVSIADELGKLVALKNSGALSEAEFQIAKKRLLEDSNGK